MTKTVQQIQDELQNAQGERRAELLLQYRQDPRKGVLRLIERMQNQEKRLEQERERLCRMRYFEEQCRSEGFRVVAGIDEAGRGPLAGPVVAGAVILPADCEILYLNDSKQVSPSKREVLFDEICEKAVAYGVGIVSPERIDAINILQATYEAMRTAIADLKLKPDCLLVDAVTIPNVAYRQTGIIKGDAKSVSIAAASIIAKVTRDRLMVRMDEVYPEYGFANHKGYGSKAHQEALKKYGPCPIHRRSFIKNICQNC